MKYPTEEEIARNVELCKFYPLGMVNGIWTVLEDLWGRGTLKERKKIDKVFDALAEYDDLMRKKLEPKTSKAK